MRTRTKVLLGLGGYLALTILLGVLFGNAGKNEEFKPQNEFKLDAWIPIKIGSIDLSINRAVFYLLLATGLTIATMVWIARRMQQKPNRVQTAVEVAYDLTRTNIAGSNMDASMATRWFPFVATLFFFIWFSNIIGFLPLPTNTENEIDIFGAEPAHLGDLCGDGQHLGPAGAHPGGLDLLQRPGHPRRRGSFPTSPAGSRPGWRT